jgi:hypothetical protein
MLTTKKGLAATTTVELPFGKPNASYQSQASSSSRDHVVEQVFGQPAVSHLETSFVMMRPLKSDGTLHIREMS